MLSTTLTMGIDGWRRPRMEASVAMPEEVESALGDFLLRDTDDEEIAFAVWYPSRGIHRFSILIRHPIFPLDDDSHSSKGQRLAVGFGTRRVLRKRRYG